MTFGESEVVICQDVVLPYWDPIACNKEGSVATHVFGRCGLEGETRFNKKKQERNKRENSMLVWGLLGSV